MVLNQLNMLQLDMYVYIEMQFILSHIFSKSLLIWHLYNPTFSLIRPLYEVKSPYISMVIGTPI